MEEMNQAEVQREETEQKMLCKFLLMIKDCKERGETIDDLAKKVEALIK